MQKTLQSHELLAQVATVLIASDGILTAKALMKEGGVITCEAPRHPFPTMHPAIRAGLINAAARLAPMVLRWAK